MDTAEAIATHYRTCNLCEAMCGVAIEHKGREILSIKGDEQDHFSRGHICPKALGLKDLFEDPDRLRKPMERTEDGWREIEWDEAFDKAAAGLRGVQHRHGDNAVAAYLGNPNVHNTGGSLYNGQMLRALNTHNIFSATSADQLPHHIVSWKLFGHQQRIPVPDIDRTDFFLMFGANPVTSNGSIMTVPDVRKRLKAVAARGQLIVVDPRLTETAHVANQHIFVKPGSDVYVLLAMLHVLYRDELLAPGSLSQWLDEDSAELAVVFAAWTPERVAARTGVPAETIEQIVRDFCAAERPVCYGRMGVSVQEFGGLCQYLIMLFNILTGRLDSEGGLMFPRPATDMLPMMGKGHFGKNRSRVRDLPGFGGELPVSAMAEDISAAGEGQIRGMLTVAGNPVLSAPGSDALETALAGLEFMVSIDFYLNETTRHANIILPPVSPLEREHYDTAFTNLAVRNVAKYSTAMFEKAEDERHDWEIALELKARLKGEARATDSEPTPGQLIDLLLQSGPYGKDSGREPPVDLALLQANPHGVDLGALQSWLPEALYTDDKKIHLSSAFFLADMPRVEQRFEKTDSERPWLLIGRRDARTNNSWLHNSRRFVKGRRRCTALLNPADAEKLGIADGEFIAVSSAAGSVELEAEVSTDIMPGVVSIPHGWGHGKSGMRMQIATDHPGVNVNELTDPAFIDEFSGNALLNGVPVALAKAG